MLHHPVSFCTCIRFKVQAVLKCFVRKHSVLNTNVAYVVCQCHAVSLQHESRVLWNTSNPGRGSAWKGYGKRCRRTLEDYREAGRSFEAAWFTARTFSKCVGHHRTRLLHSPVGTVVVFWRKRHLYRYICRTSMPFHHQYFPSFLNFWDGHPHFISSSYQAETVFASHLRVLADTSQSA